MDDLQRPRSRWHGVSTLEILVNLLLLELTTLELTSYAIERFALGPWAWAIGGLGGLLAGIAVIEAIARWKQAQEGRQRR